MIVARDLDEAASLSDRIAPEHLELCVADPEALLPRITHAGAIFLGHWTPEAIGDYVGGPNHVLPTARSARFLLGPVGDGFPQAHDDRADDARRARRDRARCRALAQAEGLQAHGLSVRARLDRLNDG
jgi:histidinol dehydrogenase